MGHFFSNTRLDQLPDQINQAASISTRLELSKTFIIIMCFISIYAATCKKAILTLYS